jgi:AAA15 family ATPase/GTPase
MILRVFIENFKSFRERTEFNMLAGNYKRFPNHVSEVKKDLKVLKNSAIYGGNAAGKTNFVLALEVLRELVVEGTNDLKEFLPYNPNKLSKKSVTAKTKFEIDFIHEGVEYSYGIAYNKELILEEWLYKNSSVKPEKVFERTTIESSKKVKLSLHKMFFKSKEEKIRLKIYEEDLRPNQPFIFEGFNKKLDVISKAYTWFDEKLKFIFVESKYGGLPHYFANQEWFKEKFLDLIKTANLGIDSIEVEETPFDNFFGKDQESFKKQILTKISKERVIEFGDGDDMYCAYINNNDESVVSKLVFYHEDIDGDLVEFDIKEESRGTRRILDLIPAIIIASNSESIFIVDEIESSIHPLLIKSILKIFHKVNKDSDSQIIFTTHESNLLDLDLLRQDEIWFFEKAKDKSTNIYSLSDFKVRHDLDVNKGYLDGKFGAIPFLGDFKKLK